MIYSLKNTEYFDQNMGTLEGRPIMLPPPQLASTDVMAVPASTVVMAVPASTNVMAGPASTDVMAGPTSTEVKTSGASYNPSFLFMTGIAIPANISASSSDSDYMKYIEYMMRTQDALKNSERFTKFIIGFYMNKEMRYKTLELYIKSNRHLPQYLQNSLLSNDVFSFNYNETESLRNELTNPSDSDKQGIIEQWKRMTSVVDKDTIVKLLKYFNVSISSEIDNWQPPEKRENIEYMGWIERRDMIAELKKKYGDSIQKVLLYINKKDIMDYYMNYNENMLDNFIYMSREPLPKNIFYKDNNLKGEYILLGPGTHILNDKTLKNKISSIKIFPKYIVKLYDANNNELILNKSVSMLKDNTINNNSKQNWNDKTVKIVIERTDKRENFENTLNIGIIIGIIVLIATILFAIYSFFYHKN